MLAARCLHLLVPRHAQRADERGPRLTRLDHIVDVSALGGVVRIGELLAILVDQLRLTLAPRSSACAISFLKMTLTAPCGPITAISAVGHATL